MASYVRASTVDQRAGLQLDLLTEVGIERILVDHGLSKSMTDRPELSACLNHLRSVDVLRVWKLARLGRDPAKSWTSSPFLPSENPGLEASRGLHAEGSMGKDLLIIMAAFAQLERDTMIERTCAGLTATAVNGGGVVAAESEGQRRRYDS